MVSQSMILKDKEANSFIGLDIKEDDTHTNPDVL